MSYLSIGQILQLLIIECYSRRNLIFLLFIIISFSLLTTGIFWPKKYTAFTIIHIDDVSILQPLMRGAAETSRSTDHVANAEEIIFGEKIMRQLLHDIGWMENMPTEIQQEKIKEEIKNNLEIKDIGKNLLKIQYSDQNQMRAYTTAKRVGELFIEAGEESKVAESLSAYNFISSQVDDYLEKLVKIEGDLRIFRSNNPDARPGLQNVVANRVSQLQQKLENTHLLLKETKIKRDSIKDQLSGEAAITISQSKEGRIREQLSEFQTQLELLRLDYRDTYPDIVRFKAQIKDLNSALENEVSNRQIVREEAKKTGKTYVDESIILSPLYQELRSAYSSTETEIATLKARLKALNKSLDQEHIREKKIFSGEETLSQLTRNYKVNQDIYQDLLKRLESARVSRNLDEEQKGFTFKIQEPAKIPLIPTGIRFMHFALAGLILGFLLPVALIYVFLILDPRVRHSQIIYNELEIPILAVVNTIKTSVDRKKIKINIFFLSTSFLIVMALYSYVCWLKLVEQL